MWIIFDVIIWCRIWANLQVIVFVMRCKSRMIRVGLRRREKWDGWVWYRGIVQLL